MPSVAFPYHRIGTAFLVNGTNSYVYHQVDDLTLAQEQWDEDAPFWLPSVNISIDTA